MKNEIKKIFLVALGISFAINLSEILYYINSPFTFFETPRPTSIELIIYRVIGIFLFCFFALYINIYKIDIWAKKATNKHAFLGSLLINGVFFFLTLKPFIYFQDLYIIKLPIAERKGLAFVWLVFLVICILISIIIKIRASLTKRITEQQPFVRYSRHDDSFNHDFEVLEKSYLTSLLLPRKKVLEPVKTNDFAIFYIDDSIVKGKTFCSKTYFIDKSIQELEEKLNPAIFFRTNRQCLINRNAVKHIEPDLYGKLKLALKIDYKENILISKLKTKVFKDWLIEF